MSRELPAWRSLFAIGVCAAALALATVAPDQWDFSIGWGGALVVSWLLRSGADDVR